MVIVLASVMLKPGQIDDALALSQQHVARSRAEPGCLSHAVHRDSEDAQRVNAARHRRRAPASRADHAAGHAGAATAERCRVVGMVVAAGVHHQ